MSMQGLGIQLNHNGPKGKTSENSRKKWDNYVIGH